MRVTRSMLLESSAYAASRRLATLNDSSTVVSSGKKINKASDDSSGYSRILRDRATISQYAQYESNIAEAETWINASSTTLQAVDDLLGQAKDILNTVGSDAGNLSTYAETLKSIYEQVLSYANSPYASGYMYSGDKSIEKPYEDSVAISSGQAETITFDLAGSASSVTIEIADAAGATIRTIMSASGTSGTNTITWDGKDDSGDLLSDGDYGFKVTAVDATGNPVAEYPTYRGDTGGKTVKIGADSAMTLNNDGSRLFGTALRGLSQALAVLENSDVDSNAISSLQTSLQSAKGEIEIEQVRLSNQNSQIKTSNNHLETLSSILNERIANLQNADTTAATVELQSQETAYEEAIATTEKLLSMKTLIDYLG